MLIKVFDAFPSCSIISALTYFVLLLFFRTFISTYWFFLSNKPISVSNNLILVVSFVTRLSVIYSAFYDNKTTIACLLEFQLTGTSFSIKMNLDIDILDIWSPAQLELENLLLIKSFPSPQYIMPRIYMVLIYCMIFLMTFICWQDRFLAKQLTTDLAMVIL